jgi:hypothetical protein
MKNQISTIINVKENEISVLRVGDVNYISLTDLAKYQNANDPAFTVKNWLRRVNTIDYIGLWENLNNEEFNLVEFDQIKKEYGRNAFTMSPSQWKKRTNAIGIIPSSGKYSIGTYAHPDIAFEFASWLSPEFKLYLITEFERLKKNEAYQYKIEWSATRLLSKTNYHIHTDAIKENIIPILTEKQKKFIYADEADVLNVALFGMTAKEWRDSNPNLEGNIRDHTDLKHLLMLCNLENSNAEMITDGVKQDIRLDKLNKSAIRQMRVLENDKSIIKLEAMQKELIETTK